MADSALRPGLVIDGRFTLRRQIGSGGCGAVWLAADSGAQGGDVVLKILHPHFDRFSIGVKQLEREAELLFHLGHPNVAKPFAFSSRGQHTYLAMEFVDGRSLDQEIGAHTRADQYFPDAELLHIMGELCAGVAHAHQRTVIHRDLKPQNVMLARGPAGAQVKVLDFGIAKLTEGSMFDATTFGRRLGSMFYMAPEQITGQISDVKSDVFALGAILFEMLTLRRAWAWDAGNRPLRAFDLPVPADGANAISTVLLRVATAPRPRPSASRPGLSRRLDEVVLRAMAIDAGERFQGVRQLLEALEAAYAELGVVRPRRRAPEVEPATYPKFTTEIITVRSAAPRVAEAEPRAPLWRVGGKAVTVEPTALYEEVKDGTEPNLMESGTQTSLPEPLRAALAARRGTGGAVPEAAFDTDRGTAADPDTTANGPAATDPEDVISGPGQAAEPTRAGGLALGPDALDAHATALISAAIDPLSTGEDLPAQPERTGLAAPSVLSTAGVTVDPRLLVGGGTELMFAVPDLGPLSSSSGEATPVQRGAFELVQKELRPRPSARPDSDRTAIPDPARRSQDPSRPAEPVRAVGPTQEVRVTLPEPTQTSSVLGFIERHRFAVIGAVGMVLAFVLGVFIAQWLATELREAPAPVHLPER